MYDPAIYAAWREAYMQAIGPQAVAVVCSLPERVRNGDAHYVFRQHSDLIYLTGFEGADPYEVSFSEPHSRRCPLVVRMPEMSVESGQQELAQALVAVFVLGAARPVSGDAHAFGLGHRRSDSKISRSRVISGPDTATAASTAVRAIAGFHPSPVSAARACVHRIAASSLLTVLISPPADLAPDAPTWALGSTADSAGRFTSARRLPASLGVAALLSTCASALTAMIGGVELAPDSWLTCSAPGRWTSS